MNTSPFLERPCRSEDEVWRKRHIETLTELMTHHRNQAAQHENSCSTSWPYADYHRKQARALEWALDQLEGGEG